MHTVRVTLVGTTPMLMHSDNIDWADKMKEWETDPDNKGKSTAGDDRTPPWRWLGCLYFDDAKSGCVTIPSDNIMRAIMEGAAKVPTGKKGGTYKALSQSGLLCTEFQWPLLIKGKPIKMADINELKSLKTFVEHKEAAEILGFSLFVKRVKIGQSKHIRVRPRFDDWSCTGEITITSDEISVKTLQNILTAAGKYKGLGDWRPGAKTPGPWGMFEAKMS